MEDDESVGAAVVFVVDDDAAIRNSLRRLITSVGFKVDLFSSAREFLGARRPDAPACLILDVRLPGLSGLDLQRELADTDAELPIIFLTGHGDIPMSSGARSALHAGHPTASGRCDLASAVPSTMARRPRNTATS